MLYWEVIGISRFLLIDDVTLRLRADVTSISVASAIVAYGTAVKCSQ